MTDKLRIEKTIEKLEIGFILVLAVVFLAFIAGKTEIPKIHGTDWLSISWVLMFAVPVFVLAHLYFRKRRME